MAVAESQLAQLIRMDEWLLPGELTAGPDPAPVPAPVRLESRREERRAGRRPRRAVRLMAA